MPVRGWASARIFFKRRINDAGSRTTLTDPRPGLGHRTQYHQSIGEADAAFDHRIYRNPASRFKKRLPTSFLPLNLSTRFKRNRLQPFVIPPAPSDRLLISLRVEMAVDHALQYFEWRVIGHRRNISCDLPEGRLNAFIDERWPNHAS